MKIQIWNAFASNNSGSYVIVGQFPTAALAAEVAAELDQVARAHTVWKASDIAGPSPLAAYAARHGIVHGDDEYDDWPQYSRTEVPAVWAIGHQVFVHSDYTVTMPPALGHAMYARGGRVVTEVDHAHHPLVAVFEVYVPWKLRDTIDIPARVQAMVDTLAAPAGVLATHRRGGLWPAWRGVLPHRTAGFGEPDLVIGAAFDDLCAAFTAVAAVVADAACELRLRIFEAPAEGDPLAHLRPCVPAARGALG